MWCGWCSGGTRLGLACIRSYCLAPWRTRQNDAGTGCPAGTGNREQSICLLTGTKHILSLPRWDKPPDCILCFPQTPSLRQMCVACPHLQQNFSPAHEKPPAKTAASAAQTLRHGTLSCKHHVSSPVIPSLCPKDASGTSCFLPCFKGEQYRALGHAEMLWGYSGKLLAKAERTQRGNC